MSKENFATRVLTLIADEYGVEVESLSQHRAALEAAADTEASITDDELKQLLSGTDASRAVNEKYPKLDAVSLSIIEELEAKDLETDDEEEDDDDEDEDEEDDEDSDDEDDEA